MLFLYHALHLQYAYLMASSLKIRLLKAVHLSGVTALSGQAFTAYTTNPIRISPTAACLHKSRLLLSGRTNSGNRYNFGLKAHAGHSSIAACSIKRICQSHWRLAYSSELSKACAQNKIMWLVEVIARGKGISTL